MIGIFAEPLTLWITSVTENKEIEIQWRKQNKAQSNLWMWVQKIKVRRAIQIFSKFLYPVTHAGFNYFNLMKTETCLKFKDFKYYPLTNEFSLMNDYT